MSEIKQCLYCKHATRIIRTLNMRCRLKHINVKFSSTCEEFKDKNAKEKKDHE